MYGILVKEKCESMEICCNHVQISKLAKKKKFTNIENSSTIRISGLVVISRHVAVIVKLLS